MTARATCSRLARWSRVRPRLASACAVLLLLAGCGSSAETNARPKVLRIAFTVSDETVEERTRAYGDLARYFGEQLGMRVVFFDIESKLPLGNAAQLPLLADVLAEADVVTLHVPETPETRNMIDAEALARMRPDLRRKPAA